MFMLLRLGPKRMVFVVWKESVRSFCNNQIQIEEEILQWQKVEPRENSRFISPFLQRYGSVATFNPKNSRFKFFCKRDEDFFSTWKPCDIYRKKTQLTSKGISGGGKRHRGEWMDLRIEVDPLDLFELADSISQCVLFFHQISFPRFFSKRGTSKVLKGIHTHLFVSSWPTATQLNLTLWTQI